MDRYQAPDVEFGGAVTFHALRRHRVFGAVTRGERKGKVETEQDIEPLHGWCYLKRKEINITSLLLLLLLLCFVFHGKDIPVFNPH